MTRRSRGRTLYVRVRGRPHVEKWLRDNCISSSGPYSSITGMRNLYWGRMALVVRAGSCCYNMGTDVGQVIPQ